jgi:hypothetical protein
MFNKASHIPGLRAVSLAMVPMALALAGAVFDERMHLGFSTWRAACRAAGVSLTSLVGFTVQLMPTAVLAALAGGLAIQATGVLQRHQRGAVATATAAHGGCALGMSAGLILCTYSLSVPVLLGIEILLTATGAWALSWQVRRRAYIDTGRSAGKFIGQRSGRTYQ